MTIALPDDLADRIRAVADGNGRAVLAWRVNWLAADRLGDRPGRPSAATMEAVDMALRTATEL